MSRLWSSDDLLTETMMSTKQALEMNFEGIEYLKYGNAKQVRVHEVLSSLGIFDKLAAFDPVVVGTIPIEVDLPDSDIDICCYVADEASFIEIITSCFGRQQGFSIRPSRKSKDHALVARFRVADFEIEIFAQAVPTRQQFAYRHMLIEYKLLKANGAVFREQVLELKRQGLKTEPAFALLLGLDGDPYASLLTFEPPSGQLNS